MKADLDGVTVRLCSAPAFMGHEEIVLPMLVLRSSTAGDDGIGSLAHCLNGQFRPNDLAGTAVVGYTSGARPARLDVDALFVARDLTAWTRVPRITSALVGLAREYAFFLEESTAPLQDAFIRRCRFVARDRLPDFHPQADVEAETVQESAATDVLAAFLRSSRGEPDYETIYRDYGYSPERRRLYGDDEQYYVGYAIWLEQAGVVRAWTRIAYVPQ